MPDSFLETENVLQALLAELAHFQAVSEKLTLAEHDVAELVNATRQLTAQFRKVVSITEQQTDTITKLQAYTEEKVSRVIHEQQLSTKPIEIGVKSIAASLAQQENTQRSVLGKVDGVAAELTELAEQVEANRQRLDTLSLGIGGNEQKLSLLATELDAANAALTAQMDRLTRLEDYDSRIIVLAEDLRNTLSTTAAGVNANEQKLAVVADALLAAHTMLNAQASRLDSLDTRMSALGMTADQVRDMQKLTRMNRRLLVLVLILTLASAGLGGYLVWLTIQ